MFESLSVIIAAANETITLQQTLKGVLQSEAYNDISQIVIFLKSADCPSAAIAQQITRQINCEKIEIYIQKTATFNTAFLEIPLLVKGSHFVIMVSDGEADPHTIKDFVSIAKQKPDSIICGSKWHKNSIAENTSFIRKIGSKAINQLAAIVFGVNASDIFSIFQIYPTALYKKLNTNLFEYTLIPLRLGIEYIEIPTHYKREVGRKSNLNLFKLLKLTIGYTFSIIRVRFTPKNRFDSLL